MTTNGHRIDRRRKLKLSPEAESYFRKTHPVLLRNLKRTARGESTPESRAFVQSYRGLAEKFRPASQKSDSKLALLVAVRLLEIVEFAHRLSERIREIRRAKGRAARHDARLALGMAYDTELWLLRRRVEALWREIPRLIEELGGKPTKDLMRATHKRRPRSPRL